MNQDYEKSIHRMGRISTGIAILAFFSYPIFFTLYYGAWPGIMPILKASLGVIPIYWTVGIIEALTFVPMLGPGGSYLGFVTGNLTALKVPCAINAMQAMKVEANTEEGDVISTIAIAISSIVTVLILFLGMLLLRPLTPFLESPVLSPAFANILPALFGALAVVFVAKSPKISVAPMGLMLILFIAFPSLSGAVSMLVPVGAIFAIVVARILYRSGKLS